MDRTTRRDWIKTGAATLGAAALATAATARPDDAGIPTFSFHHDHIIGTSLDLCLVAPDETAAAAAERAALEEIERLRLVFSTYDSASEISALNRTREPVAVSAAMADVLREYVHWSRLCGGAFSGQAGELVRVWAAAEAANELPPTAVLERIADDLRKPGWEYDAASNTARRTTDQPLNLNSVAKGYIIGRAAEAVCRQVPGVTGLLVNLGGDILGWGNAPGGIGWAVGIQCPFHHFDNVPPLAGLRLVNQAVAGSGGYQRFYTIGGKRYSHIFDPRTGRPAEGVAGATVLAPDSITANALATTLGALAPAEGLNLVATLPGVECLIVAADGRRYRSPGLKLFEVTPVRVAALLNQDAEKAEAWPAGFQVTVAVELPKVDAKRYRKPYAAIWVEDDNGKAVRTLGVWGNAPKYLKDLNDWWKIGKDDGDLVKAVARATRGPGKYELIWDGKDDKGAALPRGVYTVRVEVHREFGAHLRQSGKIDCLDKPATTKLEKNAETAETTIQYKKAAKK